MTPAPKVGQQAPGFSLRSDDGSKIALSDLRGQTVILYFYPKDDTPGCTVEACGFRDKHEDLLAENAVVLGVSCDSIAKHERFRDKFALPFSLLSDPSASTIGAYGAWGLKKFMGREYMGILRSTVLIDAEGKVAKVYPKVSPKTHAEEILADVRALS